jgi:hypothetical protein
MTQSIYSKYSQNQNMDISYDELLKDFTTIKPTFIPILDICTIKTLGSYITNITNFQKWKTCPNLIDEITRIAHTAEFVDYNLKDQDIIDILQNARNKYENPSYTINKVSYYVSDRIKESLNMMKADDVSKYFEMKSNYNNSIDKIKLKYTDAFLDIEKQYEVIADTLCENFSELENDMNFEITTEVIDSIGNEASKEVESLIKRTIILIKENNVLSLSPEMRIDFDNAMDQIYEKIIASKNFDNTIHDVILDMYGVEKAMHRMSLSLENCSYILNKINQ